MTEEQLPFSSNEEHTDVLFSHPSSAQVTAHLASGKVLNGDFITMRPPRLLLTLLGDYWWKKKERLPSAALVALLTEFGISDTAARAALNRLVRHSLLTMSKHGRQTFYRLNERGEQVLDDGARRIFSFGLHAPSWDGIWSLVAFSIPEENRQLRYTLRDRLRWLGFAPLYDGLWISPRDNLCEAAKQLSELSISTITLFRAHLGSGTPEAGLPQQAWDLNALRTHYEQFIDTVQALNTRIKNEQLSPEEALQMRTRIMDIWRGFPALDPDLPDELLPADWPRAHARQLFIETYDELGPLALRRVQQVIARYDPELARHAIYHSSNSRAIS